MLQFLQEVLQNLQSYWWNDNNAYHLPQARLGTTEADHVAFIINTEDQTAIVEFVVFRNEAYTRLADRRYSLDLPEGDLIVQIVNAARMHLVQVPFNQRELEYHVRGLKQS